MKMLVLFCCLILLTVNYASAQTEQDKLNEINNSTHSIVMACSSLGESDTNYMIFCNNILETINQQCQQVSFIFCITDVFGLRNQALNISSELAVYEFRSRVFYFPGVRYSAISLYDKQNATLMKRYCDHCIKKVYERETVW